MKYPIVNNPNGHVWKLNEWGQVDQSIGQDPHNGVECSVCGIHFCVHCNETVPECGSGRRGVTLPTASTSAEALFGTFARATVGDILKSKKRRR